MAASAASFKSFNIPVAVIEPRPFLQIVAANESRQSPIRIKRSAVFCFRPSGFAAPEERWCRFASNGYHSFRGYRFPVPTPRWLALQAIRFYCSGDGERRPIQLHG